MRLLHLFSATTRWLGLGALIAATALIAGAANAQSTSDSDASRRDRSDASSSARTKDDQQSTDSSDLQNRRQDRDRGSLRIRRDANNDLNIQSSDPNRRSANYRTDRSNTSRNDAAEMDRSNRSDRRDQRQFSPRPDDGSQAQSGQNQGQNQRQRFGVIWADDDDHWRIDEVTRGGVAARAGLRPDDEVITLNGRQIGSSRDFQRFLTARERVPLVVLRDGRRMTIWLGGNTQGYAQQYAQNQYQQNQYQQSFSRDAGQSQDAHAFLGVQLNDQYQNMAVVKQVFQNSPAQQAGLQPGDTITSVNGQRVSGPQELTDEVQQLQPGATVQLQFSRPQAKTVQIRLSGRSSDATPAGYQSSEQGRSGSRDSSQNQDSSRNQDDDSHDSNSKSHDSDDDRGEG